MMYSRAMPITSMLPMPAMGAGMPQPALGLGGGLRISPGEPAAGGTPAPAAGCPACGGAGFPAMPLPAAAVAPGFGLGGAGCGEPPAAGSGAVEPPLLGSGADVVPEAAGAPAEGAAPVPAPVVPADARAASS